MRQSNTVPQGNPTPVGLFFVDVDLRQDDPGICHGLLSAVSLPARVVREIHTGVWFDPKFINISAADNEVIEARRFLSDPVTDRQQALFIARQFLDPPQLQGGFGQEVGCAIWTKYRTPYVVRTDNGGEWTGGDASTVDVTAAHRNVTFPIVFPRTSLSGDVPMYTTAFRVGQSDNETTIVSMCVSAFMIGLLTKCEMANGVTVMVRIFSDGDFSVVEISTATYPFRVNGGESFVKMVQYQPL